MTGILKVSDPVYVDCIEGFGGPAHVVDIRASEFSRYKVQMDDRNPEPPFWAHDFELFYPPGTGLAETCKHIEQVRRFLGKATKDMERRALEHDRSKLESPEAEVFEEYTGKLAKTTYGSEEYRSYLAAMKPALDHHYAANSHHPEHFPDGIRGMSLLDLTEMLCDWKAATLRHNDGDIRRSIELNQKRFGYSDELKQILLNTLPAIA